MAELEGCFLFLSTICDLACHYKKEMLAFTQTALYDFWEKMFFGLKTKVHDHRPHLSSELNARLFRRYLFSSYDLGEDL